MAKRCEIVCCDQCGRDTPNKSRVCSRCYGGVAGDEQRGRKGRAPQTLGGTPIEDAEPDWRGRDNYHGGSIRDDI